MSIYWEKLVQAQVVINCSYSIAHLWTSEATLAHNLGELYFDDVMSYNSLTTSTLNILFQTSPSPDVEPAEETSGLDDSTNSPDENSIGEEVEDTGPVVLPLDLVGK